ncbi:MAG: hypothetical protein E7323_04265 [Clostridiales bacterium]|nr:hypothetical protein [Clostridiales bacterium]
MDPCMQRALMFVGAFIGAGFASGREVVSFFSRYGACSWGLILLSAGTMTALCALCLRSAKAANGCQWCAIYREDSFAVRNLAEGCILLLQIIMGGSMISASGHIFALIFPVKHAYLLGTGVTIAIAVLISGANLKPMTVLSSLLAVLFVMAVVGVLIFDGNDSQMIVLPRIDDGHIIEGAFRSVAYAALNLALSIGMICRCGGCSCRSSNRSAVLFGLMLTGLLLVSNYLYLKHPEVQSVTFPMVSLLARFGRVGYMVSLSLMYLAIVTTLSAGLYALRAGLEVHGTKATALWLTVLLPLAVSFAGFENLVDRWYGMAGLLCLLLVFLPLFIRQENLS